MFEDSSGSSTKVFCSYSRRDREYVGFLVKKIAAYPDIDLFIDTEDILPTEEWKLRLEGLIASADAVVFFLSPDSTISQVCSWEVSYAAELNKRIAPIVIRDLDVEAPGQISKLNYIFATSRDDVDSAISKLIEALTTDIAWIREHTRIGEMALRWQTKNQTSDLLLRGRDLDLAEQWARFRPSKAPNLTTTINSFIASSRIEAKAAARRLRRLLGALGLLSMLLILGGAGWWNQSFIKEQFQWYWAMMPDVLTEDGEEAVKPGYIFADCKGECPRMVVIPSGSFQMGSPEGDGEDDEHPQHLVTISRAFAVSGTPITFSQWDSCVQAGACIHAPDEGWGRADRPVINVSWADARLYVNWLSRVTKRRYRLLTESEWEYAARAGGAGLYSFGNDYAQLGNYAWFRDNSFGKTSPVAKKTANAFGLHDMHGNVWQWVEDCAHESYERKPNEIKQTGAAWVTEDCSERVVRGGSWNNIAVFLRSANRNSLSPDLRYNGTGFRIARMLHNASQRGHSLVR